MSYTVEIPIEVVNATHRGGYWELYLMYVHGGVSPREAFEAVEAALERYGLPCRFSSYESFRQSLWRARREIKQYREKYIKFTPHLI